MKLANILTGAAIAAIVAAGAMPAAATTVTIPDPAPSSYIDFGQGDASVTYDGVTFSSSSAISDATLFNVGSLFSGDPAVLSSQEASSGPEDILITLTGATHAFSLDYGTFDGSAVTFALSNGDTFTQGSTGSGYATPDFFSVNEASAFTSVLVTSPDFVMNVNNVSFDAVPEPATWAVMLAGFGGLGVSMRSRRKAALAAA